ncbi:MAG: HEAT repeat domain-containing protein [Acidobacteria bacterium]|nr:HEAT repeat domain-containing protein [Acidobacteriota bacterium]
MKNGFTRLGQRRLSALLLLALTAAGLFSLPGRGRTARAFDNNDLARLNRFVQSGDSPAMQVFRQGRDLIEREDWAAAAAKFEGYVAQYPKSKEADAALYWLAYARKKQGKFQAAEETLERLAKEFPRSSWVDDARAMQVEIAPQVGKRVDPEGLGDDELKMVALQSLFESDPARASAYVAEILKPDSKASPELKETAVGLLGRQGGPEAVRMLLDIARTQPDPELRSIAVNRLGQTNDEAVIDELMKIYEAERDGDVKGQVLNAFSQMNSPRAYAKLLEVARGGGDSELRQMAIHRLGQRHEAQAVDDLMRLLASERDDDIRASILHAFSQLNDPRAQARLLEVARGGDYSVELRAQAIHWVGQRSGGANVDELMSIYRADRNDEIRGAVLHALSQTRDPRARAALLEVARGGDDPDVRVQAIHALTQFNDDAAVEDLVKLYDGERDEDVKGGILQAFSQLKQERALLKLMDVARADPSREMRKQAIHLLGQSHDPRALKLLQDLLR